MSQITIETEKTDYTGGDVVNGRCSVTIEQALPARGIRIRYHGYERSSWTTGSGKNRRTHTETRTFFDDEQILFGQPKLSMTEVVADALKGIFSKEQYEILEPGTYTYDFSYRLPFDLPGDFEQGSSKIVYEITAYVDLPLKLDIKATQKLTIYESYAPETIAPISTDTNKTFLFDSKSPLDMSVTLNRNVYFPGEPILATVKVTNQSQKTIKALKVTLLKIVSLRAHKSSTSGSTPITLYELPDPAIPWGRETSFDLECVLPDDLYCTITSSRLVKVEYEVEFRLDVPWAIDLKLKLPITLLEEAGMPSGMKLA